MKVRMKVGMATASDPREPGHVIEVSDDEAERLIAADFAESVEDEDSEPNGRHSARKRQAPKVETATDKTPVETPED